jgi:hypothetical protein
MPLRKFAVYITNLPSRTEALRKEWGGLQADKEALAEGVGGSAEGLRRLCRRFGMRTL